MLLVAVPSDRDPGSFPGHFLWNLSRQSYKEYIFLPDHLGLSVNYRSTPPAPCYNPGNGRVTLISRSSPHEERVKVLVVSGLPLLFLVDCLAVNLNTGY